MKPSTKEIKDAWNAMILNIPKERIDILEDLKQNYRVFLLSNTNSIHQDKFLNNVNKENNSSFNNLFEKAYYSHEIGIRKPDLAVFKFVLNENNLIGTETLFVDDSIDNIDAAKKANMNVCHIKNENLKLNLLNSGVFI